MLKNILLIAMVALFAVTSNFGQGTSTLKGQVVDKNGAAVTGATVTITSDQLQGQKTAVTDDDGNFVFLGLVSGTFTVEAAKSGFKTLKKADVQLRVGQTITVPFALEVGDVKGSVEVKAGEDTPIVDTTNPENAFNVSGDFVRQLPMSTRQNWEGIWFLVPGAVTLGANGPDGVNYDPSINGASARSNAYKLNGFEIGSSFTNQGFTTQFSTEAIQDVVIKTAGADASTPLGQGGFVNVVTKSGSNKFNGSVGIFFQPQKFNWTNIPGGTSTTLSIMQPEFSFGGPVTLPRFGEGTPAVWKGKDKLWFFTSYRYVDTSTGIARSPTVLARFAQYGLPAPDFKLLESSHRFTGKLTYQMNNKNSFVFNYLNDKTQIINADAREQGTIESTSDQISGGPTYQIAWTGNLSSNFLWTAQYGYRNMYSDQKLKGGDSPSRVLYESYAISSGLIFPSGATLLFYGNRSFGFAIQGNGTRSHHEFTSDATYLANLGGQQHTIQGGVQFKPKSGITGTSQVPSGGLGLVEEVLINGQRVPIHKQFRSPTIFPSLNGDTSQKGFYIQDKWQIHPRFSLSYGIRTDNQSNSDAFKIQSLNTWTYNPRFGVAFSLNKEGRDVIRASWGRYSDIIYLQAAPGTLGGTTPEIRNEWDNNLDGFFEDVTITPAVGFGPTPPPQTGTTRNIVDPNLHPSYKDEFQVSYVRQLPLRMVLDAGYIQNSIKDTVGTLDTNIIFQNGQFLGYKDPSLRGIFLRTNLKNFNLDYKSFQLSLIRNIGGRFSFFTNYTYQVQTRKGQWAYDDVNGYLNPADYFEDNKLQIPHIFRVNGDVRLPWGFKLSSIFSLHSGFYGRVPIKVLANNDPLVTQYPSPVTLTNGQTVTNPLRSTTRFLQPQTAKRLIAPMLPRWNVRLGKDFNLWSETHKLETSVDFYNITNDATPRFFANDNRPDLTATYGTYSSARQSPRGAQITIRYRF